MKIENHNVNYWRLYLKKNEEEEEEKKRRDYLKSVVRRNQQMPATVRSDCNEGDTLGSTQSYIVLYIVLLFQSFIVLPNFPFSNTYSE